MEKKELTEKKHPYNRIKVKDGIIVENGYDIYFIRVYLDCTCGQNDDQLIVSFTDNELLCAEDNFKGWFTNVSPWFIQNGYKIVDTRQGKECTE